MTVKAYAYSRYSSAAQASGDSLRRQLKSAVEFAEAHGIELDTTLQDRGVSGFTGANRVRGALGSFIRKVQDGEIEPGSFLVLDSMDRLSRETETEVLHLLTGLTRAGIKVVDQAENMILDEKAEVMDFMRVLLNASRAHKESKEKGRKIHAAHSERKRQAREQGRIWHATGPSWLKLNAARTKFEHVPHRVATVRAIFDMREQGLGCSVIAKRLNDQIIKPFRRAPGWSNGTVHSLLKSRTVLGEYQPKFKLKNHGSTEFHPVDGEAIAGYYGDPVIDQAQFHRVQAILVKSASIKGRKANSKTFGNLFQGVSVCGSCGGTVGYQMKHGKGLMLCNHAAHHTPGVMAIGDGEFGQCTNTYRYNYDALEAAIIDHITDFDFAPKSVRNADQDALDRALGERDGLAAKIANLLDQVEGGGAALAGRLQEREAELAVKDCEILKLKGAISRGKFARSPVHHIETIQTLKRDLDKLGGNELYDLRSRLSASLKSVIDYLTFEDDGTVYAVILGGAKAYRFEDGFSSFADVAATLPGLIDRQSVTGGEVVRERLFDKIGA